MKESSELAVLNLATAVDVKGREDGIDVLA
jgi:hypothetical protein